MKLIEKYAQNLYQKIRNRFSRVSMIDENGKPTINDKTARIFNMLFLKNNSNTMVTISIMDPSELKVYFDKKMAKNLDKFEKNKWFEFLNELRKFTISRQMGYDLIDLEKPGLDEKDIQSMIQSRQEINESKFSPMNGSTKTSYQLLEKVKIKVRHAQVINDDVRGSRSRNIKALFIENNQGERFRFPFLNLAGVRAMARHLEEGGNWNDSVGHHILEVTNNLCTIKQFVREVRKQKIVNESLLPMLEQLKEKQTEYRRKLLMMSGSKGYHAYVTALTEMYVEPVTPISEYFSAVDPAIQKYIPSIERILGEKTVESISDEIISEQIGWGLKKFLIEQTPASAPAPAAPTATPAGAPAPASVAPAPTASTGEINLKIPKQFPKGKKIKINQLFLQQIGITNPQAEFSRIPAKELQKIQSLMNSGDLEFPVAVYYKDARRYDVDPAAKNVIVFLLKIQGNKPVHAWEVSSKDAEQKPGFFRSFGRAFNKARQTVGRATAGGYSGIGRLS